MGKIITDEQFQSSYRSAGLWFVALYMEAFLLRIDELRDKAKKTYLVEEIYNNGESFDKEENGARTRVNALSRIIESGRSIQALETASSSERLKNDFPDAAKTATDLLERINSGDFIIPEI